MATSYNNIGVVYKAKGEYDKALEYYQKSLAIRLKQLGPDHPDVATSYNNIGLVYDNKAEYDKALEYYQKSLAIRLKQLGPDHPDVANSYHNIAFALQSQERPAQGQGVLGESLCHLPKETWPEPSTHEARERRTGRAERVVCAADGLFGGPNP